MMALWTHTAALLIGAAAAATGAWHVQEWRYGAQIAAMKRDGAEALATAERGARAREQALLAAKTKVDLDYERLKKQAAAAAAGAGSALDGLRNELAARDERAGATDSASCARLDGASRLERDLLGHCAQALVGLAAEADRLEAQLVGLQSYVRGVCLAPATSNK